MKAFFLGTAAAIVIAIGAALVLEQFETPAASHAVSSPNVRL
ncbi:MAG: hypothetical protein ACFB6S_12405 [Geminicoccaceae bacterium]